MTKTLFVVGFCFFCFFLVCLFFLVCHQTFWLSLIFVLPANAGHGRICGCILAGNVKNTASTRQLGKNAHAFVFSQLVKKTMKIIVLQWRNV